MGAPKQDVLAILCGAEKEDSTMITLRLPNSVLKPFKELCEQQDIKMSAAIRNLLRWALDNKEAK